VLFAGSFLESSAQARAFWPPAATIEGGFAGARLFVGKQTFLVTMDVNAEPDDHLLIAWLREQNLLRTAAIGTASTFVAPPS
jgi:hypothetical protein